MSDTRQHLLDAAQRIVRREGIARMTLAAVAAEAGVSKGGLLYHFASKHELIAAMLARRTDALAETLHRCVERDPDGGLVAAYVASLAEDPLTGADAALLAAAWEDPALLAGQRQALAELHGRLVAEAADPVLATIVRLACNGLDLTDLLDLDPVAGAERDAVLARLAGLAAIAAGGGS